MGSPSGAAQQSPGVGGAGGNLAWDKPIARVQNPDGSVSTVRTISTNIDGKEVLIPTVSKDGRIMSNDEAIQQYMQSGENFGKYDTVDQANQAAEQLHQQQSQFANPQGKTDPNIVRQVLGGMDLRGLSPEDVYQLMGSGLQNKQLDNVNEYYRGKQTQDAAELKQRAAQDIITNQQKGTEEYRKWFEMKLQSGEVKADSPVQVGDKWVQRYHDKYGNLVKQEDIGAAPSKDKNVEPKLLRTPDGKTIAWKEGMPIPDNSTYLPQGDKGESLTDELTLSSLKGIIETGKDSKNNSYEEPDRDAHMQLVNARDKYEQYVKIPGKTIPGGGFAGMDKNIPSQYVKIPKQASKIMSLPDDKVIYFDDKSGKSLDVGTIKQIAKDKGYTPEEFLKIAGIAK